MGPIQRILQLFRSLFPYWKFFDRLGGVPRVDFRYSYQENLSEWHPLHPPQKLKIQNLFINEKINLIHWEQSLILQFMEEGQKLKKNQLANHETYIWIKNRISFQLSKTKFDWFQFRIKILSFENDKVIEELWLESESIEENKL